jgi:sulfur-oxidizing protein SoxY
MAVGAALTRRGASGVAVWLIAVPIATFHPSPALGRAELRTRILLAGDQRVVARAKLSDGRVLRAAAEARVVTSGCFS